jgi:hypothetical protein
MNYMTHKAFMLSVCALMTVRCTNLSDLAGAGSETTNSLTGVIAKADGSAPSPALVLLIPHSYDIVKDPSLPGSLTDTTDSLGRYDFRNVDTGIYSIQAAGLAEGTRALMSRVHVAGDTVIVPTDTLQAPGSVKVMLPDSANTTTGYLYVPGTTIFIFLRNSNGSVVLDSVPAGAIPAVSYSSTSSTAASVIRYDVPVAPGDTTIVWNPSWKYARTLRLNTTPSGAGVAGTVVGFPVLVRLPSGNFSFAQAKADGADIRFTKPDNTFLPYEIEQWDSAQGAAAIWVKADTILGSSDSQNIVMYWGNPDAAKASNSAAVFDTANGFQGVWHLSGSGTATAYDATGNHYDGTPYNTTASSSVAGAIGNARAFNGSSQYITMSNTASSKLNFPEDGSYSMSVWVYADALDTLWRAIAGKGHEQYYVQLKNFGNGRATWEFVEFQDQKGWYYTEDSTPPAPGSRTWLNLVGVRSGTSQRLYINGQLVKDGASLMGGAYARTTTDNFMIGRYPRSVSIPYYQGFSYFKGRIDEVRVCNAAPSADWIKLCYMNQKGNDALVVFETL